MLANCACQRDKYLIKLLFDSGMRVREIARIKAGDFNWSKGTVTALGKGNKQRKAVFTEDTARMSNGWFKE